MAKAHKHPRRYRTKVPDPVPVAPLRDYFQRQWRIGVFTPSEVAISAGWFKGSRPERGADTTRVLRLLGIRPGTVVVRDSGKRYRITQQEYINYDHAVRICRAMGADPVDFGL